MKRFNFLRHPLHIALTQKRLLASACLSSLALLTAPQAGAVMLDLNGVAGISGTVQSPSVSGDGKVVAGLTTNGSDYTLFRWDAAQGFTELGTYGSFLTQAAALSSDGTVMVGTAPILSGNTNERAFRWTAATGFTDLGTLGGSKGFADGVSDDGSVVVGTSWTTGNSSTHAFRWTTSGMQDLGTLADINSQASDVSGDGNVVVGFSGSQAFRWEAATGMVDLGSLGSGSSVARATNRDGSVVVGNSNNDAFRWTEATGMQSLGAGLASDVNADGSVVVGGSNNYAFRWTEATGMTNLGALSGASGSAATSVSADGNTVVGISGGRGFIWRPDAPAMQDLANLQRSQITSADTLGHLTASQNRRIRDLNQQLCLPGEHAYCLSAGLGAYSGEGEGSGKQGIAQVGGGLRLNEQFAIGASANLGRADLNTEAAQQDNAYGLALWVAYQQQADALGWSANASLAVGRSNNTLERGANLADVQRAKGRTQLNSTGVRIAAGYGLKAGESVITPEVALSQVTTTSQGFTEHNTSFPLTLKDSSSRGTYATLGVRSATPLNPKATLNLGVAVDALLQDKTDAIEGSSNVPGLSRFELRSNLDKRNLVPVANAGVSFALSPNASVSGQVQVGAATYEQQKAVYGAGVQFRYAF